MRLKQVAFILEMHRASGQNIQNSLAKPMKYIIKYIVDIAAAALFIATISTYASQHLDDKTFLAILGSIAALYFGIIKYRIENDKMFKELFESFNKKYDETFNDLLNEIKNSQRALNLDEKNKIIDYLNLSAEEYLWYSKNRIPSRVWKAWKAGITDNLKIEQVNEIFKKETSSSNGRLSYYGLVEELEK